MTDHELLHEVTQFLQATRTASLATVDANGQPHAANVQFVPDDQLRLVFVSSLKSAHSEHIALDPHVAMTIYAHVDEHTQIHGIQLHGRCERITEGAAKHHAWSLYLKRFDFITADPMLSEHLKSLEFYLVTPTWLRWIDNRRGFGFKREMALMA